MTPPVVGQWVWVKDHPMTSHRMKDWCPRLGQIIATTHGYLIDTGPGYSHAMDADPTRDQWWYTEKMFDTDPLLVAIKQAQEELQNETQN